VSLTLGHWGVGGAASYGKLANKSLSPSPSLSLSLLKFLLYTFLFGCCFVFVLLFFVYFPGNNF
jgi:hypothetical protein